MSYSTFCAFSFAIYRLQRNVILQGSWLKQTFWKVSHIVDSQEDTFIKYFCIEIPKILICKKQCDRPKTEIVFWTFVVQINTIIITIRTISLHPISWATSTKQKTIDLIRSVSSSCCSRKNCGNFLTLNACLLMNRFDANFILAKLQLDEALHDYVFDLNLSQATTLCCYHKIPLSRMAEPSGLSHSTKKKKREMYRTLSKKA